MEPSEEQKRSEAFQRGLGKSTAEIEATRKFIESGEQPSPEAQARYQAQEEAQASWKKSEQEKRSEAFQRGMGRNTAQIEAARRANEEAGRRMLGEENNYAAQLAQIRTMEGVYKDIKKLREEGEAFGHPSYFKYFICGSLALLKDGLDIAALFTLVTVPMWWLVGPSLSILVVIIFWFFNIKQQRAKDYMKDLEKNMEIIQTNIVHAVRIASRVPGVKKRAAKFGIAKIASLAGRSPTITVAVGGGLETIPLVSLAPWNTIAVILSYWDERKIYRNAAKNGEEAYNQLSSQLSSAI